MTVPKNKVRRSVDFDNDQYEALKLEAQRTRRTTQGMIDFIVDGYLQTVTDVNPIAQEIFGPDF